MGFTGEKLNSYLKQNLPGLWNRYDVMGEGNLDADRVAVLLRQLLGQVEIAFGL